MDKPPTRLSKIFGSDSVGLLISLALFFIASWLNTRINLPPISHDQLLLNAVFS